MREIVKKIVSVIIIVIISVMLINCGATKAVTITSQPAEAQVYINGKLVGVTPYAGELSFTDAKTDNFAVAVKKEGYGELSYTGAKTDNFAVAVKKEGYEVENASISFDPKTTPNYHFELVQIAKTVNIKSDPQGASLYLDGEHIACTPANNLLLDFSDKPEREIILRKEGHFDKTSRISLLPINQMDYAYNLEEIPWLEVNKINFEPIRLTNGILRTQAESIPTIAFKETIERSPNVKSMTQITNIENSGIQVSGPIVDPILDENDIIVYCTYVNGKDGTAFSTIWQQKAGSFAKTKVTFGKWLDLSPHFKPDGKGIVFSSNRVNSNATLFAVNLQGGRGIQSITRSQSDDNMPFVAPNGKFVVYTSMPIDAKDPQIWLVNINGSLPTQIREGSFPQVSPDGKKIMFVRKDKIGGKSQIWVMNLDGTWETLLTQNEKYDCIQPRWSPDGQFIIYSSDEGLDSEKRMNYDIWLLSLDGDKKIQLTTNGSWDDSPYWSPDGENIYFRSNRGGYWNIWRFSIAKGKVESLITNP